MADGQAQEKVRKANDVRWKEYAKMAKVERKLVKRLSEDPGQRPFILEPSLPINLTERTALRAWSATSAKQYTVLNVQQLSGGRTKDHEGKKPGDWCQRPRYMQGKAGDVCELAGEPTPTTVLPFFMGDIRSVSEATSENLDSGL